LLLHGLQRGTVAGRFHAWQFRIVAPHKAQGIAIGIQRQPLAERQPVQVYRIAAAVRETDNLVRYPQIGWENSQ
jgi:hypothetical protein